MYWGNTEENLCTSIYVIGMGAARILARREWDVLATCFLLGLLSDHADGGNMQWTSIGLYGVTSRKTAFFIVTIMRILNPICGFLQNSDEHYPVLQHTPKVYISTKILRYLSSV
jgi:hypothetical protein